MTQLFSDTRPEAEDLLIDLLRRAPPWRRLRMVSQLNASVRSLGESGLRTRYPQADEEEIVRRLADLLLGPDLAAKAYGRMSLDARDSQQELQRSPTRILQAMNEQSFEVTLMVTAVLEDLDVPYVIGGSLASALHGVARSTLDSDLVAALQRKHVPLLVERLQTEFYIFDEAIYDAIEHHSTLYLIHLASMFKVDIFIAKPRAFDQAQLDHGLSYVVVPPDRRARVASAEDTLLAKLDWYQAGDAVSDRQWQDVLGILRVQAGNLDEAYLQGMADTLGVVELLQRALREAEQGSGS